MEVNGMINRAMATEIFLDCLGEEIDREAVGEKLASLHPFDLSDFQEALDELEALIIEARKNKTITVEDMEAERDGGFKIHYLPTIPPDKDGFR
jgi:hypothetical protein